jgi:hypothetical protein
MDSADVEQFVRGTLGCSCPDEVFRSMSMRRVPSVADRPAHTELLVGSRLLIRVVEAPADPAVSGWLERLVADGQAARDRHGYNRFRLVVVVRAPGGPNGLEARFARAATGDERAHLHLLAEAQLPASLRAASPGSSGGTRPAAATLAK